MVALSAGWLTLRTDSFASAEAGPSALGPSGDSSRRSLQVASEGPSGLPEFADFRAGIGFSEPSDAQSAAGANASLAATDSTAYVANEEAYKWLFETTSDEDLLLERERAEHEYLERGRPAFEQELALGRFVPVQRSGGAFQAPAGRYGMVIDQTYDDQTVLRVTLYPSDYPDVFESRCHVQWLTELVRLREMARSAVELEQG